MTERRKKLALGFLMNLACAFALHVLVWSGLETESNSSVFAEERTESSVQKPSEVPPAETRPPGKDEKPSLGKAPYQNFLPLTEVHDLNEKASAKPNGFDDEDRSFSDEQRSKNFSAMENLAKAIVEYVDLPNAVRALLTTAKLNIRMQRTAQGWQPVRITGEPYLRAIFAESWLYLSKQSEFRKLLEGIDYPSVRFQIIVNVQSALAMDEAPRSRVQGNFIALDLSLKRTTTKEWSLLAAWLNSNGQVLFGFNVIGLAQYAYDAYKNRGREDPVLQRLRQSPAYRVPVNEVPH